MKVLGVAVREIAPGVLIGRAAQLAVEAARLDGGRWCVSAVDTRTDEAIAYGSGVTIELAEMRAQDYFLDRMHRMARRAA